MGKRRIRNLQFLQAGELIGYDPRLDRCQEAETRYGIPTFTNFDQALMLEPDTLIISTPPDRHTHYACIAARHNKHFFTEASVIDDGLDELIRMCEDRDIVAAPSCTLRFHPSIRKIKEIIDEGSLGPILSFTYHSGQYLPDWHPWEDYREFYVAKRETGACREIVPFELVWLTWILGDIEAVSCFKGKLSSLDVDIDDIYHTLLQFKQGTLGHLLVDVISRVPYRTCRFVSEYGVIEWTWSEKRVRVFQVETGKWVDYMEPPGIAENGYISTENMYIEEMRTFVKAIRGDLQYPYSLEEDQKIIALLKAAEQSSENQTHVQLAQHLPPFIGVGEGS
jgi:predicted dehydrogenase